MIFEKDAEDEHNDKEALQMWLPEELKSIGQQKISCCRVGFGDFEVSERKLLAGFGVG